MAAKKADNSQAGQASHRIAVILGAGGSNRRLLNQLLPLLGQGRNIEMQGVFIEEADVQYAAELPFVQELCRVTFSVREFTSDQFERALVLRMHTARRAIDVLARRTGVRHSFRSVRGSVIGLLRETASSSDMTVFEPARLYASQAVRPSAARQQIVVVVSDSDSSLAVMRAASHLASGANHRIATLIFPAPGEDTDALREQAARIQGSRPSLSRLVEGGDIGALVRAVRNMGASILVLPASAALLDTQALRQLRDQLRCPICMVRRWDNYQQD